MIRNYRNRRMMEAYSDSINLTDEEIQKVLSVLLRNCSDKALENLIRRIIFGAMADIDWQGVWDIIIYSMPELTQYHDFNSIIRAIR